MPILTARPDVEALLRRVRTIAVLGAHVERHRPAFYVPAYLAAQGYTILPVNPRLAGREIFGRTVVATLADLDGPVDLVDVFRPSHAIASHRDELLAARPSAVWLQLGIRDDVTASRLDAAGIDVVQDRCTLADHQRWGLPPV